MERYRYIQILYGEIQIYTNIQSHIDQRYVRILYIFSYCRCVLSCMHACCTTSYIICIHTIRTSYMAAGLCQYVGMYECMYLRTWAYVICMHVCANIFL